MSRTSKYKLIHLVVVGTLVAAACVGVWNWSPPWWGIAAVALVFLIPGRIQGHFWRDLFRGRRFLAMQDYPGAAEHYERFIAQIRDEPWRKRLIWLGGAIYTPDPEAMALNNLGVARLWLRDTNAAREALNAAITLDSKYAIPYFNLAVAARLDGKEGECETLLRRSQELGYRNGSSDRLVALAQAIYARIEGSGSAASIGEC